MDEETKARFDDVSAALGTINTVLAEIIEGMATKAQLAGMATKKNLTHTRKNWTHGSTRSWRG